MATIQDLIKERTVSQDVSDANFLLKKLRRDMMLAQQEDKQRA
jgi:hypothetical protein